MKKIKLSSGENALVDDEDYQKINQFPWKAGQKWRVKFNFNRKELIIGYFDNKIDAVKAYNHAIVKYRGEFAYVNVL